MRTSTQALGAEFVSFDAEAGKWTFDVAHFSRYAVLNQCSCVKV